MAIYSPKGGSSTSASDFGLSHLDLEQLRAANRMNLRKRLYADVQWWNASSVYVLCPICHEIHQHQFDIKEYTGRYRRLWRCSEDNGEGCDRYILLFPFDTKKAKAWYYIDKDKALFVSGNADPKPYFERRKQDDLRNSFKQNLRNKPRWSEAKEDHRASSTAACGIKSGDESKLFEDVIAAVVRGDVEYVLECLETSSKSNILLRGVEDSPPGTSIQDEDCVTGRTVLHLAAEGEHFGMVVLFLKKGADPNAQDAEGRTPLMEAALWGRLDTVRHLILSDANPNLYCIRDGLRLKAVDFARLTRTNAKERHQKLPREDTFAREMDRGAIVRLLEDTSQPHCEGGLELYNFKFIETPGDDNLITLIAQFHRSNERKTIGAMDRTTQFPVMAAMSGWTHAEYGNTRVAGDGWTKEVFKICKDTGFNLPGHHHDQGIPGQFYASHAEKQLVAYFVKHHVFLKNEVGDSTQTPSKTFSSDQSLEGLMSKASLVETTTEKIQSQRLLSRLKAINPPTSVTKATIMVSRRVCDNCSKFIAHINQVLRLDISVSYDAGR